jgi:hypothetical protein
MTPSRGKRQSGRLFLAVFEELFASFQRVLFEQDFFKDPRGSIVFRRLVLNAPSSIAR